MAGNCFNHREHKGFLGWDFNNDFLAGLRDSLPNVRKRTRVGQVIDAKVLNLPSKGDRSNTCVRSEGCCRVSEPVNCRTSVVRQHLFLRRTFSISQSKAQERKQGIF